MKRLFYLITIILFCSSTGEGLYWIRSGFSLRRIQHPTSEGISMWETEEADAALSQKYSFLARGRQCFAFISEDKKYVLKLPRTDIYKIPLWTRCLPVKPYRNKLQTLRTHREQFVKNSFLIAHQDLKEQTALLAIHLGVTTRNSKKKLIITDPIGCSFHLPLEQTSFVLQRNCPILMPVFLKALKQNDRKKAEEILTAFIDVVIERAQKGVFFSRSVLFA